MQGHSQTYGSTWRQISKTERKKKQTLHRFKGYVNSSSINSSPSKGVIKGQGVQRCKERSKVVKFILYMIMEIILSFWGQPIH